MKLGIKILLGLTAFAIAAQFLPRTQMSATPTGPSYSPDLVKMAVQKQLRDPSSAQFGPMNVYGDRKLNGKPVTVVCGSVNAKNGFGGYVGEKNFIFIDGSFSVAIDNDGNNARFVQRWNSLCAGKHEQ